MIKTAFAGFEHPHMTGLYNDLKSNPFFSVSDAFEPDSAARKRAEENGVAFGNFASYAEFLKKTDADVVAVGSHYAARGKVIIEALKAGKHIIADKPFCTRPEELAEIRRIAGKNNLGVCILLSLRKSGSILAALEAVKSGTVGKINNIIFEGEHPLMYGKRADWYFEEGKHGGVINDIAIHGIDLVRIFTDSDVDKVIGAREWNFYAREVPHFLDSAQFMLKMKSGAGVIADVSYSAPNDYGYSHPAYWHIRLFGEKGLLDVKDGADEITFYPSKGEITKFKAITEEKDLLTEFAEILHDGTKINEYTEEMLNSTEQTLTIQKHADNSEH